MKKVININFQGRVVPIEETSYDLLKQYTDSLRIYFANEEGRDEIINDIESRIGELFQERIKNGATCITDDDVNGIINNIGRPQDLADADEHRRQFLYKERYKPKEPTSKQLLLQVKDYTGMRTTRSLVVYVVVSPLILILSR